MSLTLPHTPWRIVLFFSLRFAMSWLAFIVVVGIVFGFLTGLFHFNPVGAPFMLIMAASLLAGSLFAARFSLPYLYGYWFSSEASRPTWKVTLLFWLGFLTSSLLFWGGIVYLFARVILPFIHMPPQSVMSAFIPLCYMLSLLFAARLTIPYLYKSMPQAIAAAAASP